LVNNFNHKKGEVSMKKTLFSRAAFVITLLTVPMPVLGYRYFYRAGPYVNEPRFDRNCLSTIDAYIMGGSTTTGRNAAKAKTNVLGTYGDFNLAKMVNNVPDIDPFNPLDANMLNVAGLGANGDFGKVAFSGKFKFVGASFHLFQNLCRGFFAQWNIPCQKLQMTNITYTDQSPTAGAPNANTPQWVALLNELDAILTRYGYANSATANYSKTGVGDMQAFLGWTYNNESSDVLDFFDTTIKLGVSIPTASKVDTQQIFSIPAGYNGHPGIMLEFDMALGMYEWFTWGAHVGGTLFFKEPIYMRVQTNNQQNGYIMLAAGAMKEDLGNLWNVGTYAKADHIAGGLSLMFGYTYTAQEKTTLAPYDTAIFPTASVNNNSMLGKWVMQSIHVAGDYDFSQEGRWFNPKIGIFYDRPVAGKRIFNTDMIGGLLGANITWEF